MSIPKGYKCTCGTFNAFSAYVYAHADVDLVHKCKCNRKWIIRCVEATLKREKGERG